VYVGPLRGRNAFARTAKDLCITMFSACYAIALRGSLLPGLKSFVRVPAGPANHPVEALLFGIQLQLTVSGASKMQIMITWRWDPAGDDRRVGRVWPGPGVVRAVVTMSLESRPG
jgi:hypothetical protein